MKAFLKIFLPIILALVIIVGTGWYLLVYDKDFTRDALLYGARYFESRDKLNIASWFYDRAYEQGSGSDEIAVELARQYIESGNYTQAEITLNRAIKDGGGTKVYVALCKAYVEQDKLLDAVELLDNTPDAAIKEQLDALRPAAPTTMQTPGIYSQYISVTVESPNNRLYVAADGEYPSVKTDAYTSPITLHDGENVLYAIAVSDDGLVSPLTILGYTVGGVIQEITFEDSAIEQTVRYMLNVSDSKTLYSNDLWAIKEFDVPEDAASYADLKHMAFLETLTISNGVSGQLQVLSNFSNLKTLQITDTTVSAEELEIIGTLTALESLTLNSCGLSTTAGLSGLTALQYLDLSNNAIRNISALSSMTELKELIMHRNALQDLSSLSPCTVLTKLDVSYNSITSVSPLAGIPLLSWLDISYNQLSDISQLSNLKSLSELRCNNNTISDISQLANCSALTYLDVSENTISNIDAVSKIDSITYFDFSNNQVSQLPQWPSSSSLVTIDGSYNLLSNLSGLKNLQKINKVLMDYNEDIESIDVLADCPVLIQVNVYGTKVKDVKKLTDQSIIVNYNPLEN